MKKAFLLPLIPPTVAFLLCAAVVLGALPLSVASVAPGAEYDAGYGVEYVPGESAGNDARSNDARSNDVPDNGVGDVFEETENDAEDIPNGATSGGGVSNYDVPGVDDAGKDSDGTGANDDGSNPVMLWIAVILAVALIAVVAALIPRKKSR